MPPKLFNRFKIKTIKTEEQDDDTIPIAQSLASQLGGTSAGDGAHDEPLSTFQQIRAQREVQQSTDATEKQPKARQRVAVQVRSQTSNPAHEAVPTAGVTTNHYLHTARGDVQPVQVEIQGHSPHPVDREDDVLDAVSVKDRGTEFLQLGLSEAEADRKANCAFFLNSDGSPKVFDPPQLSWMQLPRLPAAPAFGRHLPPQQARELLPLLPPGRVGKLRIHRSGRVTLVFDDVSPSLVPNLPYEVSVNTAEHSDAESQMAQNLVAIIPSPDVTMSETSLSCYDLGPVTSKLICVPDLGQAT